ncbi:MAG: hypothetical protein QXP77_02015 [Candidatus Aenigmatarchaeota archaeon]
MDKNLLILILFLISLILLFFLPERITFLAVQNNVSVNISEKLSGRILLGYKEQLNFSELQSINVEFLNEGSIPLTEKMEIKIYYNRDGQLEVIATYYDAQVTLKPGEKRVYRVNFLPPYIGTYYIRARSPYDGKTAQTWGAFIVIYYPPPPPPSQIVYAPPTVPPVVTPPPEIGVARVELEYPQKIEIAPGESTLFHVLVKNVGDVSLYNLRFSVYTSSDISVEITPMGMVRLYPNETGIFLFSLQASEKISEEVHPFEFELISDKIRERRSILMEVKPKEIPVEEDLYKQIIYYEYLISEIQSEIDAANLMGMDTSLAQISLNKAKISLGDAKSYYYAKKYDDAKLKLLEVKKFIEEAVLQLSLAKIGVYIVPAYFPIWVLIFAILLGIFFLILLFFLRKRRRREEERPALLRRFTEAET